MGFISEGASQVGCVDEVHTRRLQPLSRTPATWASPKQAVCFTHSERSSRRKMPSNVSALLLLNCPPRFPSPSAASSSPVRHPDLAWPQSTAFLYPLSFSPRFFHFLPSLRCLHLFQPFSSLVLAPYEATPIRTSAREFDNLLQVNKRERNKKKVSSSDAVAEAQPVQLRRSRPPAWAPPARTPGARPGPAAARGTRVEG